MKLEWGEQEFEGEVAVGRLGPLPHRFARLAPKALRLELDRGAALTPDPFEQLLFKRSVGAQDKGEVGAILGEHRPVPGFQFALPPWPNPHDAKVIAT